MVILKDLNSKIDEKNQVEEKLDLAHEATRKIEEAMDKIKIEIKKIRRELKKDI
jgi:hypothetical protein